VLITPSSITRPGREQQRFLHVVGDQQHRAAVLDPQVGHQPLGVTLVSRVQRA